jgi:hypothetical protein
VATNFGHIVETRRRIVFAKMKGVLNRITLRFGGEKTHLVLLVPFKRDKSTDPVVELSPIIRDSCIGSANPIFLPKRPEHFSEIQLAGRRLWRQVVLFAHPSPTADGFAVNPQDAGWQSSLTTDWWYTQDHEFDLMVAHVCNGHRILSREEWQQIFPKWISYDIDIHALLMNSRDNKLWGEIGASIVKAAVETDTIKTLKARIHDAYRQKMAQIRNSGMRRDIIHLLHFQRAMDGLTSNEED